jgi:hypothetical protein
VTFISAAFTGILLWLVIPHQAAAAFLGVDRHFWLTVHICFGLASLAGSVLHVVWHRLWLKALRGRRIASLPAKIRSNRIMDRYVWITFIAMNVFGALDWIIPVPENNVSILSRLHVAFGMACLLGITVHLALHAKWIFSTIQSNFQVKRENVVIIELGGLKDLSISNR